MPKSFLFLSKLFLFLPKLDVYLSCHDLIVLHSMFLLYENALEIPWEYFNILLHSTTRASIFFFPRIPEFQIERWGGCMQLILVPWFQAKLWAWRTKLWSQMKTPHISSKQSNQCLQLFGRFPSPFPNKMLPLPIKKIPPAYDHILQV